MLAASQHDSTHTNMLWGCSGGFIKRDGRSRESEVLVSRLTDRPLRPMFEKGWNRETQVRKVALRLLVAEQLYTALCHIAGKV